MKMFTSVCRQKPRGSSIDPTQLQAYINVQTTVAWLQTYFIFPLLLKLPLQKTMFDAVQSS